MAGLSGSLQILAGLGRFWWVLAGLGGSQQVFNDPSGSLLVFAGLAGLDGSCLGGSCWISMGPCGCWEDLTCQDRSQQILTGLSGFQLFFSTFGGCQCLSVHLGGSM